MDQKTAALREQSSTDELAAAIAALARRWAAGDPAQLRAAERILAATPYLNPGPAVRQKRIKNR